VVRAVFLVHSSHLGSKVALKLIPQVFDIFLFATAANALFWLSTLAKRAMIPDLPAFPAPAPVFGVSPRTNIQVNVGV
jgi:hypothetical protein